MIRVLVLVLRLPATGKFLVRYFETFCVYFIWIKMINPFFRKPLFCSSELFFVDLCPFASLSIWVCLSVCSCGGLVDVDIINLLFNQLVWLDSPSAVTFSCLLLLSLLFLLCSSSSVCSSLLMHWNKHETRSMTDCPAMASVFFVTYHPSFNIYFSNKQVIINGWWEYPIAGRQSIGN